MSMSDRSERKGFIQIPALSDNRRVTIVAVAFCILHIPTDVFLVSLSAPRSAAPSPEQILAPYD